MTAHRDHIETLDYWALAFLIPVLAIPLVTGDPFVFSVAHQVVIAMVGALGAYIMLRLNLLAFTVPAFMAIGGYAAAMLAKSGTTSNLFALMGIAFVVPALVAVPLGALVLRLKGTYFILVTFICSEIFQVLIFETPTLSGGSNGISAIPPASLLGVELWSQRNLLLVTVGVGLAAALATLALTHRFRTEFLSIEENEVLAGSLGMPAWKYRTLGFAVSAGVSGLGGFALVNQLSTAHPGSFTTFSAINYVAYVFIGGRRTMLGAAVGAALLVTMSNIFSSQTQISSGLFGVLLILVVLAAPAGIVGSLASLVVRLRGRRALRPVSTAIEASHE